MCPRIQQTPQHSHSLMIPISRSGIIALIVCFMCSCSEDTIRGEFQEDVPGGGQAILKYELQNNEIGEITESTESTKYFVETTFSYVREELSALSVVISEYVRNDNFEIIDAKEVATIRWVVSEKKLVLKEGHLDAQSIGKNRDYLTESKRMRDLVKKHLSRTR